MFQRAIVRSPCENFAAGLTTVDLGNPILARALEQHEAYCAALQSCGLMLTRLDTDEHHPDSTFVEDTAVLTTRCAIIARPGAPSRTGEVSGISPLLKTFYSDLEYIHAPGTLDGGDVCEACTHYFIGISQRTNEAGAEQLAATLASFGYTSSLIDIRNLNSILHLKSGLAYLGDNRLIVTDDLAHHKAFLDFELVGVRPGEEYAANCIRVNDRVLIAAGHTEFAKTLQDLGYNTIALDMSEFQKMDGGLSCLSLRF